MASIKYYFGDNREYGAGDIKAALGTLAAESGVAIDFGDGEEYDASALNAIVGSAVASGVVPEGVQSLKLQKRDDGYFVSPGKAVFSDGGIAVLEAEEAVNILPGQYLYLAYSEVLDDVYFLSADTEQSEGSGILLVPIGRVSSDGGVENRRKYVRGKVPAVASARWSVLREEEFVIDISSFGKSGGYVECVHELEGEMNFMLVDEARYIGVMYVGEPTSYNTVYRLTSRDYGRFDDSIGVESNVNGFVTGTFLEKGNGYIKMRYRVPGGFRGDEITYRALVGLRE